MFEDIEKLHEDILYSTSNTANIMQELSQIKSSTICVGSGGSKVVARFAESILTKKNGVFARTMEPQSFAHYQHSLYDNVLVISHGGKNFGVKATIKSDKKSYLLTTSEKQYDNCTSLVYDMPNRHSFISISDTLIPMAILLKYYLGSKFISTLDKIFSHIDKELDFNTDGLINIMTSIESEASTYYLESTLVESGITSPIIHYKYDYCHGRSTINKSHENIAIYLGYAPTDLDKTLVSVLRNTTKEVIILKNISKDAIINDFYFTLASIYLTANLSKKKRVNLKDIDYDRLAVKNLYYFKGSM